MRVENLYVAEDKFVIVNDDDRDLDPVVLRLPKAPSYNLIDGYGQHPDDQYWKRLEVPPRLRQLEDRAFEEATKAGKKKDNINGYNVLTEYWDILEREKKSYKVEIDYIRKIHWYLTYGYWFYNDGKPTYITPWHFLFLNFWTIPKVGYPTYKDVDRRSEIFSWYNFTTTETFADVDDEGLAYKVDGKYRMKDVGRRTSFGVVVPKRRRRGETHRGLVKIYWIAISNSGVDTTIVADTGEHAKEIFTRYFIPAWKKMPLFMKPSWDGSNSPAYTLSMKLPPNIYKGKYLDSQVAFTESAKERGNDFRKLYGLLDDEVGKVSLVDTNKRWEVTKPTLCQGLIIHGYSEHPSTVEEMEDGGYVFQRMCDSSKFYVRSKATGQTISGLSRIFFDAAEGREGYLDRFGMSVIAKPTERQRALSPHEPFAIEDRGAGEMLDEEFAQLMAIDEGLYLQRLRKDPRKYADVWKSTGSTLGLPIVKMAERIIELKRHDHGIRNVDFMWENNVRDSRVVWKDNGNGRFEVSNLFLNSSTSAIQYLDPIWSPGLGKTVPNRRPINPMCVAGSDPYKFANKSEAKLMDSPIRLSDGGGAVFWTHDPQLDPGKDMSEWQSYRFVCSYRHRLESIEAYYEDMLMMSVYFNALLCIERNAEDMWRYFLNRGYDGYLMRLVDNNGKPNDKPGYYLTTNKDELFNSLRDYLQFRVHAEKHIKFLEEAVSMRGPEDLNRCDRVAAHSACLIAVKYMGFYKEMETFDSVGIDLKGLGLSPRKF